MIDVRRLVILAARSDLPEIVREKHSGKFLGLVPNDHGRTERPLVAAQGVVCGGGKQPDQSGPEDPVPGIFSRQRQQRGQLYITDTAFVIEVVKPY